MPHLVASWLGWRWSGLRDLDDERLGCHVASPKSLEWEIFAPQWQEFADSEFEANAVSPRLSEALADGAITIDDVLTISAAHGSCRKHIPIAGWTKVHVEAPSTEPDGVHKAIAWTQ